MAEDISNSVGDVMPITANPDIPIASVYEYGIAGLVIGALFYLIRDMLQNHNRQVDRLIESHMSERTRWQESQERQHTEMLDAFQKNTEAMHDLTIAMQDLIKRHD